MSSRVTDLPFELAIATLVQEGWYSNALPEWYTPEKIDVPKRTGTLARRAARYAAGDKPLAALEIDLPRVTSGMRPWVVPAVNDQMILQACVANLAARIAEHVDRTRVYSCVPSADPSRIALMEPQIPALLAFQQETSRRLQHAKFMLELDIRDAFASIPRDRFFEFVYSLLPGSIEAKLVRHLVEAWSGARPGVPLVNDSLFLLGSAFLEVVDRAIAAITPDFVRYMDDYRVFGSSSAELESRYTQISEALARLGFRVNLRKVRLVSVKDLTAAYPETQFASRPKYLTELDPGITTQLDPSLLVSLVGRSLAHPDECLNEGFGRCLLGALRRYRLNSAINRRGGATGLGGQLQQELAQDGDVQRLTLARLAEYAGNPPHAWRAIWVVYVIEQQNAGGQFRGVLELVEKNVAMPLVAKLWARRCRLAWSGEPEKIGEELHDLSYLDAGLRCYGEKRCTGEGF